MANRGGVVLLILDGLGFNRARLSDVAAEVWDSLSKRTSQVLLRQAESVLAQRPAATDGGLTPERLASQSLLPVSASNLPANCPFDAAVSHLDALSALKAASAGTEVVSDAAGIARGAARRLRYVPAAAQARHLHYARNSHLTVPTKAAGKWVGYEDVTPPVQGNSDSGHEQLLNLTLAEQLPLQISNAVVNGSFYANQALERTITQALSDGRNVNFCFLLSGVRGHDGRIHSSWNHLEAFLELLFRRMKTDPRKVRMQAILDGRDSPPDSSLQTRGDAGGYIDRLQELLDHYGARRTLAWVIGRAKAMDRDYHEANVRADYLLLTKGEGQAVDGFAGLRRTIAGLHRQGTTDQDIPPIVVNHGDHKAGVVAQGDAFINLNYRPDRQRAKVAALAGARSFLESESRSRGRPWRFGWLRQDLGLRLCTLSDCHPGMSKRYGVRVAFPNHPHTDNLLALLPRLLPERRYMLIGESDKSLHMGYYIRGRRETPEVHTAEARRIVASQGESEGVVGDSDIYKSPEMRCTSVAEEVIRAMSSGQYALICANLAATDMLGHLLPKRFEEAVSAYEAVDGVIGRVIPIAREFGYHLIITSDHGNIEDDTPSHTTNDVLTTVIPPRGRLNASRREHFQARLYDVPWVIGRLLGVENGLHEHLARRGDVDLSSEFVGKPFAAAP